MTIGLKQVLEHLQQAGGGLTDGQLLGRFATTRDEASFAALVRRHGPMVLGVCRRVLRDFHDAEDAFQATFLVLAQKAASVVKRESVSCWLHGVAYHTALSAGAAIGRRRAMERQVGDMPHPEVAPPEVQDWLPLLDRELSLLPEKYRAAIVECDLEGKTRREVARRLGLSEGTLSSRLARGRALLSRRLAAKGVALSGGALTVAVPTALVNCTAKAAALVVAGKLTAAAPAVVLMKGVMKVMLLKKLRVVVGAVMVMVALGAIGLGFRAGDTSGAAQAAPPDKPKNELEALRRENELLKLNLEVVLEKVRAQETELQSVRKQLAAKEDATKAMVSDARYYPLVGQARVWKDGAGNTFLEDITVGAAQGTTSDPLKEAEAALKALREAKDEAGRRRATEALEKALQRLKPAAGTSAPKTP